MSSSNYIVVLGYPLSMPASRRAAWYQTLSAYTALLELMDRELQADCGMPLVWYDVLVEIAHAPGRSLRMSELADRVLLSRSWITRRVNQLEQAGLLQRQPTKDDQRGVIAALTPYGLETFQRLEKSHTASIRRHFSEYLDQHEATTIAHSFAKIARHAHVALADDKTGTEPERDATPPRA